MDGEMIKSSFMEKRSLGRSAITKVNYKKRFFILTHQFLKYCAGTPEVSFQCSVLDVCSEERLQCSVLDMCSEER
jgi:hypothetical protein